MHDGALNMVFQDTSNQYKEQHLQIYLCPSLEYSNPTTMCNYPTKQSFLKCSDTPETLTSCNQVTSKEKHTIFVVKAVQSFLKLQDDLKKYVDFLQG